MDTTRAAKPLLRVTRKVFCRLVANRGQYLCRVCDRHVRSSPHLCKIPPSTWIDRNKIETMHRELAEAILESNEFQVYADRIPHVTKTRINLTRHLAQMEVSRRAKRAIDLPEEMFCRDTFDMQVPEGQTQGTICITRDNFCRQALVRNKAMVVLAWNERDTRELWQL